MSSGAGLGGGFSGGLITGVFAPVGGGGSTISESPVGGGLKTLGSSVGIGGAGFAGFGFSGTVSWGVAGACACANRWGVDAVQALAPTAMATIAAPKVIIRMAHLISLRPPRMCIRADDG
jgi:hypothetical protein